MVLPVTVGGSPFTGVILLAPNREKGGGRFGYMVGIDSIRHFPHRADLPDYSGERQQEVTATPQT